MLNHAKIWMILLSHWLGALCLSHAVSKLDNLENHYIWALPEIYAQAKLALV